MVSALWCFFLYLASSQTACHTCLCVNSTLQVSSSSKVFLWSMTHGMSNCSCPSISFSLLLRKWEQSMFPAVTKYLLSPNFSMGCFPKSFTGKWHPAWALICLRVLCSNGNDICSTGDPSVQSILLCILHPVCLCSLSVQAKHNWIHRLIMLIPGCLAPSTYQLPLIPLGWMCLTGLILM